MSRALSLDVGNRRIGLAISDPSKLLARPLWVIDRKVENALVRIVDVLAREYADVDEIVIGMPLHVNGNISTQAQAVRAFADALQTRIAVPIRFVDERHSTQDAKAIIAETKKRKQPIHDDAIAAAVILQRYLDEQRDSIESVEPVEDEFE
jgi:putative Holliday junction resolvase